MHVRKHITLCHIHSICVKNALHFLNCIPNSLTLTASVYTDDNKTLRLCIQKVWGVDVRLHSLKQT